MVMTVAAVMVTGSGCGATQAPSHDASSKPEPAVHVQFDPEVCWTRALAKWIPGSYAKWTRQTHGVTLVGDPAERRAEYRDLVMTDAKVYENGGKSPLGIDEDQRREFAKLQQACGNLRLKVTEGQSSGHFF